MKTKIKTQVKHALKKRLIKAFKELNFKPTFESRYNFITYFYNNYVDINKFDCLEDYHLSLGFDSLEVAIKDEKEIIKYLVKKRMNIIYRDIIIECGGIDL